LRPDADRVGSVREAVASARDQVPAGQTRSRFTSPHGAMELRAKCTSVAIGALFLVVGLIGGASAQVPLGSSSTVLAINPSSYTTEQDNFTVSLEVANTAGIQFVYFTFCQLSSPVCYLPVSMALQGTNWYVGTTKPMTSYLGMTVGVRAGYNITIVYSDNQNVTEPTVPNPFGNLTIAQSVTGEYMFQMTVSPSVYALRGVVADSATSTGISGARVSLTPGTHLAITTGSTGAYSFPGLLNGTYTVSVSQHGYQTINASVAIAGRDAVKDISLANDSSLLNHHGSRPSGMWGLFNPFVGVGPWVIAAVLVGVVALVAFAIMRKRKPKGDSPSADPSPEASPGSGT
jgi:Carboxypeptidase regulatory-like domain